MHRLITNQDPASWQELEESVCAILAECGMRARRQVKLDFPRGGATVDVMAEESVNGIVSRTICECKNWKTKISQDVVHSFRTVMQESGAHRGYIISKVGFQSGAVDAARATNIELVTFAEFQDKYFDKWYDVRVWEIEREVGALNTYYEPFGIPGMSRLEDQREKDAYYALWRRWRFLGFLLVELSPYLRAFGDKRTVSLPINIAELAKYEVEPPVDLLGIATPSEYFSKLINYARIALSELRALNPITREKAAGEVDRDD
jgi:Restriction endonuclease